MKALGLWSFVDVAELPLAGDAVVVAVHLGVRAVLQKKLGLFARCHLRAEGAAIAFEQRVRRTGRACLGWLGLGEEGLGIPQRCGLLLLIAAVHRSRG